eukprot:Hpha_TRINITY_DN10562_c0_g1::TRINITY_DN10562_c0_g1_i1::g.31279::m.31279
MLLMCAALAAAWSSTLEERLEKVLATQAAYYNTSFSLGVYWNAKRSLAVAAGVENRETGAQATTTGLYPSGSVTKSYTVLHMMRLQEQGVWNIDDFAYEYADPVLKEQNGTTLRELFGDARVEKVTLRHLAHMRSGLQDYDDGAMLLWTLTHPNSDLTPLDYLHMANKTLLCDPGTCGSYSSIGYLVLGLALTHATGGKRWQDYDQKAALPSSLPANHTKFLKEGPCSKQGVVNQYRLLDTGAIINLKDDSCLNGWTMGNIAAAPLDMAAFYWTLLSGKADSPILSPAGVKVMSSLNPLTTGWSTGLPYGLGLMLWNSTSLMFAPETIPVLGHGGEDWGSMTGLAGYVEETGVGLVLAMGSTSGLNMSAVALTTQQDRAAFTNTLCSVYSEVREDAGLPKLDCPGHNKPDGVDCVCPADEVFCPLSTAGSPPSPQYTSCNKTLWYTEYEFGATCKQVMGVIGDDPKPIEGCCAPSPKECKPMGGACLCPDPLTYHGDAVLSWNAPYTCEETMQYFLPRGGCSGTTDYLKTIGRYAGAVRSCCAPYIPPAAGACLCESETEYKPSAVMPWNPGHSCEETYEFLMVNSSTTCEGVKKGLATAGLLNSSKMGCCSATPTAPGACLCDLPSDYNGTAPLSWDGEVSCDKLFTSLASNLTTTCAGSVEWLQLEGLLDRARTSCCLRAAFMPRVMPSTNNNHRNLFRFP